MLRPVLIAMLLIASCGGNDDPFPVGSVWRYESNKSTYLLTGLDKPESEWRAQNFTHSLQGKFRVTARDRLDFFDLRPTFSLFETPNTKFGCPAIRETSSDIDRSSLYLESDVNQTWAYVSIWGVVPIDAIPTIERTCDNPNAPLALSRVVPLDSLRGTTFTYGTDPLGGWGSATVLRAPLYFATSSDHPSSSRVWALRKSENITEYQPEILYVRSLVALTASTKCIENCPSNDAPKSFNINDPSTYDPDTYKQPLDGCSIDELETRCHGAREDIRQLCRGEGSDLWVMTYSSSTSPLVVECNGKTNEACVGSEVYEKAASVNAFFSTDGECDKQFRCDIRCYGWRP